MVSLIDSMEIVRRDCAADAKRPLFDSLRDPTTAELRLAVSTRQGEMLAMIDAVAAAVLQLAEREHVHEG